MIADRPVPILYLCPHGERAGAESFLDALIRGHRVGVESTRPSSAESTRSGSAESTGSSNGRPRQQFEPLIVCGSDGAFAAGLRADGFDVTVQPLKLSRLLSSVSWLRGYLRERGIRLIHTTMGHYHQFAWLATRGLPGAVKTLWFNHGPCSKAWWKGIAHAFPADAVVVEGRFVAACHRGFTLSPSPVHIPLGIEPRWLTARPELRVARRAEWAIADHEIAFGILGRIQDWKRQHCFLEAAARVPAELAKRCHFLVGGSPALGFGADYYDRLRQLAESHPHRDRVRLLGFVPAEDFVEAIDVSVHCAHEDPFPVVILESLAKGKVVIGSTSGGVPEMIADGANGYLCEPTDAAALAAKMADVAGNLGGLNDLRAEARRTVRERFTAARATADFERLYAKILRLRWADQVGGNAR